MEIAKSRHIITSEILQYYLLDFSPLFDSGFFVKPHKNVLVNELENMTPEREMIFSKFSDKNIVFTVFILRRLPLQSDESFNNLFHSVLEIKKSICKFHQFHIVYDCYVLAVVVIWSNLSISMGLN